MKLNIYKLLTPDFTIGKIIVLRKAIADSVRSILLRPSVESFKFAALMLKLKPRYTMVTNKNLVTLYNLVREVTRARLPGDIVECGVWNGGSAAVMGYADAQENAHESSRRTIWLFDSFEGLPPVTEKDVNVKKENYFVGWNKGSITAVKNAFSKLGLPLDHVKVVPGWFETTLKTAGVERIAILHIDADWYESVKIVLDVFYEKIVPGGYVILNDFGTWDGCNQAVDDFFAEHGLSDICLTIVEPGSGAYFQKPVREREEVVEG